MTLEIGQKITIVRISEIMASTVKYEAIVKDLVNDVYVIQLKGKRKLSSLPFDEKTIVLSGWFENLVDSDTNRFSGNACFNFLGTVPVVRSLVDGQLNPNFAEKDRVLAVLQNPTHEEVAYPELVVHGKHAVIDRLLPNKVRL